LAPYIVPPVFDGSRFTQFCVFPKSLLSVAATLDGIDKILGPVGISAKAPDGPLDVTINVDPKDVLMGDTIHRWDNNP
jgi:hypothetical protein